MVFVKLQHGWLCLSYKMTLDRIAPLGKCGLGRDQPTFVGWFAKVFTAKHWAVNHRNMSVQTRAVGRAGPPQNVIWYTAR
jgi:hypothetical protein